jgi:hypothetical protein
VHVPAKTDFISVAASTVDCWKFGGLKYPIPKPNEMSEVVAMIPAVLGVMPDF